MKFRKLIFANLFRKKVRLILTVGSFAIALVLFTFLAVVKSAFNRGVELAGADRLIVVDRVGLMNLMPISYADKIAAIPGVKAVTHDHWFGGVYQDEKNFFPQFLIDVEMSKIVRVRSRAPSSRNASIGKSATASPSKPPFTAAQSGSSTSMASITPRSLTETRVSSGSSGNTLTRTFPALSRAPRDGTSSGSITRTMPSAWPRPLTKNLPIPLMKPRRKLNPHSPPILPSNSETSNF